MWNKLNLFFRIPELRNRMLFVLGMLALFRLAASIPVPGIDKSQLQSLSSNQFFGLFNLLSGGALENLSIVMLGVGPYITASIIMQLMTVVIPRFKEIYQEEGEAGRARFNRYTRFLTLPLAFLQSYALLTLLRNQGFIGSLSAGQYVTHMIVVSAGSILLMWLGELISEKGIGNGISLMIFAGIVAGVPGALRQELFPFDAAKLPGLLIFLLVSIIVIAGVVVITEGQRNIPVSYAKRIRGNRVYGGVSTHLPLRVNQAGVIPIIFAVSIILFPGLAGSILLRVHNEIIQRIAQFLIRAFENQLAYGAIYFLLVFVFTYFYTAVTFDPHTIADQLQKQGGFILGIRPGRPTAVFLSSIVSRITLAGALFLGTVAILPLIANALFAVRALTLGGTALLIVISVVLETAKQIDAQLVMREYESL